jgi:hypothetical protein
MMRIDSSGLRAGECHAGVRLGDAAVDGEPVCPTGLDAHRFSVVGLRLVVAAAREQFGGEVRVGDEVVLGNRDHPLRRDSTKCL